MMAHRGLALRSGSSTHLRPPCPNPPAQDLTRDDFKLPVLGAKLLQIRDEVVVGKGFHVIR